ncbi:hypothetical protein N9P31_01685 [bacterium]|nr:hypothetical protein [bacterium]
MKASEKLEADTMNTDSHLFLDTLEQMREILSSPDIESRIDEAFLTQIVKDFYLLTDEYAMAQSPDITTAEDPEKIKIILAQLISKIDTIEQHVKLETDKLSFLSKVTPKN